MSDAALGNLFGTAAGWWLGSESQRQQFRYQEEFFRHQHQWEVEDLKAAGLNPILSATHGPIAGGNVSPIVAPDINSGMKEYAVANRRINEVEKQHLQLEAMKVASEVDLNSARAAAERSQSQLLDVNSANQSWLRENQWPLELQRLVAETRERHTISDAKIKELAVLAAQAQHLSSGAELNKILRKVQEIGLPRHVSDALLYKDYPGAMPWVDRVTEFLRTLGLPIAIGAGASGYFKRGSGLPGVSGGRHPIDMFR